MVHGILTIQIIALVLLFAEALYICFRRPSHMQVQMLLTVIFTIITLVGYTIEITATDESSAMLGVYISYLGKPFALLCPFLFICDYCGRSLPDWTKLALILFNAIFPAIIFTNSYHYLYYSYVEFDRSRLFSPLRLGHGPLYFLYMVKVVVNFILILSLTIRHFRTHRDPESRVQLLLLFGTIFSSVIGYVIFLTGYTRGYDTTMAGAILGTVFLSILFFRYRFFDVLTLARDQAVDEASCGILVLTAQGQVNYANAFMNRLLNGWFRLEEFAALPRGKTVVRKGEKTYEMSRADVVDRGWSFGKRIEVSDITDRYNYSVKLEKEVDARAREILRIQRSIVSSFAGIVEARDNSTGEHINRMSRYVDILARSLRELGFYTYQLTDDFITSLVDVAPLHDIGKISIPDSILLKPGKLTNEEFAIIKTHTVLGAQVISECLSGVERPEYVALAEEVALCHHEKWDGSGYPRGLARNDIPLSALIIGVADVYDAVRSERVYKPAMTKAEARQIILDGNGTHFSPALVAAFEHALTEIEAVVGE